MRLSKIMILFFLLPIQVFALGAGQEGGGGNELELDFVKVGRYVSIGIQQSLAKREGLFDGFHFDAFKNAVGAVQIRQVTDLCSRPGGAQASSSLCLDAYYHPAQKLIEINADTWQKKSCLEKMAIVVHEYGRASGNEGGDYAFSSRVALSRSVLMQCIPYENQAGSAPLSCPSKATYLELSLHEAGTMDTNTELGMARYLEAVRMEVESWAGGIGRDCAREGQSVCTKVCFLKVGSRCFEACGIN